MTDSPTAIHRRVSRKLAREASARRPAAGDARERLLHGARAALEAAGYVGPRPDPPLPKRGGTVARLDATGFLHLHRRAVVALAARPAPGAAAVGYRGQAGLRTDIPFRAPCPAPPGTFTRP